MFRSPTERELERLQTAFEEEYYPYGQNFSLDELTVGIIENYETEDGSYQGELAVIIDGMGNASTFGFDNKEPFVLSQFRPDVQD